MDREGLHFPGEGLEQAARELRFDVNGEEKEFSASIKTSAVVSRMRNKVKGKRAGRIAWGDARKGMHLYNRDAIQTFKRSSAVVRIDEENHLDLGENTLVIIRQLDKDLMIGKKRSVLVMVDGDLRGRISGGGQESVNVEIATPSASTIIRSGEGARNQAEFKVSVNPDKSSTITVFEGIAEVGSKGQTVRVEANQGVTVNLGESPGGVQSLPKPPVPVSPSNNGIHYYRDLPPKILFSWKGNVRMNAYRFILAKDPGFRDVVEAERISKSRFAHGNLEGGIYYWRVSGLTGWKEGAFSETRRIRVVKDVEPPLLQVHFPTETVGLNQKIVLRGMTEPGAHVFVQGKPVRFDESGAFEHPLMLKPGVNIIVVEAVDAAGNVTYRSRMVDAIYGRIFEKKDRFSQVHPSGEHMAIPPVGDRWDGSGNSHEPAVTR
ncbi:MAG: hypothetical protein HKM86_08750 [Deltaproteobacteria bacterium]|nr:hypothetical protein [Deltaproteobacteria bacterium]